MKQYHLPLKRNHFCLIFAFAILVVVGIFLAPTKAEAVEWAEDVLGYGYENTYYVTNIEELNEVFGGNHLIDGQTLILQSDVELDYCILIDCFAGNRCIIDLNGKTIKVTGFYFLEFGNALEPGLDYVQLIGDGTIISDSGTILFFDGTQEYRLILSGNITYRTAGWQIFEEFNFLTIEDGTFELVENINGEEVIGGTIYLGDFEYDGDWGNVTITGGRFYNDIYFLTRRCTISGGIFDKDIFITTGRTVISGGVIKGHVGFRGRLTVKENAYIRDGIVLKDGTGTCIIKGGYIGGKKYAIYILADGENPDQDYVTLDITGGTIESRSKNGYGIYCEGTPPCRVTIKNCTIRSKNGNGKSAIYLKDAQSVKLKADAGKKTLIKGFKYGLVDKNGGSVKIDKKAVVKASLTKKKYTSKDKLGKTIKGNLTIYSE